MKVKKFYFSFLFILIFLIINIKVYANSPIPLNDGIIPTAGSLNPAQAPSAKTSQVLPASQQMLEIPKEDVREELQPLVEDYLTDTQRDLDILNPVLDNFTQLVTSNLFTLKEVKNALKNDITKELEPVLAEWFQLQEKLDLKDLNQVNTLIGFADLCLKKNYNKDDITSFLQNLKPKTEIGLEEVKAVYTISQINAALQQKEIKGVLEIDSSIIPDNPFIYFSISFSQTQNLSNMQSLSFKLSGLNSWDIKGANLKAVIIKFIDPKGNVVAQVRREGIKDGDVIQVEKKEVEEDLNKAGYKVGSIDIGFEFEVKGYEMKRVIKLGNKTIVRKRHINNGLINSGNFTISEFKITQKPLPPFIKKEEDWQIVIDFIGIQNLRDHIGFPSLKALLYLNPLIDRKNLPQVLNPRTASLIFNCLNKDITSSHLLEVLGILGSIGEKAKDIGLTIQDKDDLKIVLKKLIPDLNNYTYPSQELLNELDKFYYPCNVRVWFWNRGVQGFILKKVDKKGALKRLEELKSQGVNPEEIEMAKLKIILESSLQRKLNLKNSLTDRLIFTYWKDYLKQKDISLKKFDYIIQRYENNVRIVEDGVSRGPLGKNDIPQYIGFLPYVPPDMVYGLKEIAPDDWCAGCVGFCNPEFKRITLREAYKFNPRGVVLAHELTHFKDFWTFSSTPSYLTASKRYADISNLYYDVYGLKDSPSLGIDDEDESVAYNFGDFASADVYSPSIQDEILQLMLQYLYGYDRGYGSYYFYDPDKLPLSFKEVREKLNSRKDLPPFYREALDLTEMIFYNWRRQAGFKDNCKLLEKYDNMSYDKLKEKIKQDFPHFYPEAIAFGVDFIRRLNKDSSLPEILQGLTQAEFVLKNSFTSLPAVFDLLNRDIPDLIKMALIGKLGEKVKLGLQTDKLLETSSRWEIQGALSSQRDFYLKNINRIITKLIDFTQKYRERATGKFTFCLLYELSQLEEFPQNLRGKIAQLGNEFKSLKNRLDKTNPQPVMVLRRYNPITETEDELNIYSRSLFFQRETMRFLSQNQGKRKEEEAKELIFSFWEDLVKKDDFLDAFIQNGWEQFLIEMDNFIKRDSFRIYKKLTTEKETPSISTTSILPAVNLQSLPLPPKQMKLKLMELNKKGQIMLTDFDSRYNEGGSLYGSWNAFPQDYSQYCKENPSWISLGNIGSSLRLDYDVDSDNPKGAYNGFWMKIPEKDLSQYQALVLFIKGDEITGFPQRFKISLEDKENVEVYEGHWGERTVARGDIYIQGIDKDWKMVIIPLKEFLKNGNLKDLTSIDVLSLTFEKDKIGQNVGTIYIDEIGFVKDIQLLLKKSP